MADPGFPACAKAVLAALQQWYDPATGLWTGTGWWNSANALTALIRYTRLTGDTTYRPAIAATYAAAARAHPGFINSYYDDTGWWALAWVAAYDLTGSESYLSTAEAAFAANRAGWDSTCGGGLWWNTSRTYKNAVTTELFFTLAALLHQRVPGDQYYLEWALRAWDWFDASGLTGPDGLVNDGLTGGCANNGQTAWTYNQGIFLGGLAALYQATGDAAWLAPGETVISAVMTALVTPAGILAEPCEGTAAGCDGDQVQFKGIFMRYLGDFCQASPQPAVQAFITANAASIWDNARNAANQAGLSWAGPPGPAGAGQQSSALDALNAAIAVTS